MSAPYTPPSVLELRGTFGSRSRSGDWDVPDTVAIHQRFGSTKLDLTEARIPVGGVMIDLDVFGGSVEIRVPADTRVVESVDVALGSVQDHHRHPDDTGPVLTVRGRLRWGSVELRGPKRGLFG